ncbi:MAG: methyltransferase domain-containing protein [Holophagales bacterium]|nr:MAG: methyltransferase domain-containing protein [Holophagales bacterium]
MQDDSVHPLHPAGPAVLLCTVRNCGLPLAAGPSHFRCASGHTFDRARRGWVNLLQPQDRRSRVPGDSRAAALARRRLVARGIEAPLHRHLLAQVTELEVARPAVLDVGCGEGSALAFLAERRPIDAHGVDLSAEAIDLAAMQLPRALWVVANADRGLPFAAASFDLAMSLLARRPVTELARVLRPGGRLLVAVPAPDDLAELREVVQGAATARDRLGPIAAELAADFELVGRERCADRLALDRPALDDLLAASYRGARAAERARFADVERLEVTSARDVGCFRRR